MPVLSAIAVQIHKHFHLALERCMVSVGIAQIILNGEGGGGIYQLDFHGMSSKVQRVALLFLPLAQLSTSPFLCLASLTCLTVWKCCGSESCY